MAEVADLFDAIVPEAGFRFEARNDRDGSITPCELQRRAGHATGMPRRHVRHRSDWKPDADATLI